jgi:hypothetical protein
MSFEAVSIILIGVMTIAAIGIAGAELRSGRIGWGDRAYDRHSQPAEYWFQLLSLLIFVPAIYAVMLFKHLTGHDGYIPLMPVLFTIVGVFWLVRGLQTGVTGIADLELERRSDPSLYWTFLALVAAFIVSQLIQIWV